MISADGDGALHEVAGGVQWIFLRSVTVMILTPCLRVEVEHQVLTMDLLHLIGLAS